MDRVFWSPNAGLHLTRTAPLGASQDEGSPPPHLQVSVATLLTEPACRRKRYPCWGSLLPLQEQLLCPEARHPAHPATSRDKSAWVQPPVGFRLARSTEVTSQVDTPVLSTCVPRQRCHAVQVRWTCAALAIANQNLVDPTIARPCPTKNF